MSNSRDLLTPSRQNDPAGKDAADGEDAGDGKACVLSVILWLQCRFTFKITRCGSVWHGLKRSSKTLAWRGQIESCATQSWRARF